MKTVLVHGFLGLPLDWEQFIKDNNIEDPVCINLWNDETLNPSCTLQDWGEHFIDRFKHEKIKAIGYSLGGRLLFQAFYKNPQCFESLETYSSNPFQPLELDRDVFDSTWSEKFRTYEWAKVMDEWNHLPLFKHDTLDQREGLEPFREPLAKSLTQWSPKHQTITAKDLTPEHLERLTMYYGDRDSKYKLIHQAAKSQQPKLKIESVPHKGHRIIL